MQIEKILKEIGLSNGEIEIYLLLLELGPSPVKKIKERTKIHRTSIYDFIEKLINKSLLSYFITNNVKQYRAVEPKKLLDFIKEKEDKIKSIIPKLEKRYSKNHDEVIVEVYKGLEGFKTVLNDIIRSKEKNILGCNIEEKKFKETSNTLMEQYFRRLRENKMKEKILTYKNPKFIFDRKVTEYRYIKKDQFYDVPSLTYKNKVVNIIWEPLTIIMITSENLANGVRKNIEIMWENAKKD